MSLVGLGVLLVVKFFAAFGIIVSSCYLYKFDLDFITFFFFFSSRRRHTRCYRDWSSDVCSSDLGCGGQIETVVISPLSKLAYKSTAGDPANFNSTYDAANILRTIAEALGLSTSRSEERRVGKEWRARVGRESVNKERRINRRNEV